MDSAPGPFRRPPLDAFTVVGTLGAILLASPLANGAVDVLAVVDAPSIAPTAALVGALAVVGLWVVTTPPYGVATGVALVAVLGGPAVTSVVGSLLVLVGGSLILLADVARRAGGAGTVAFLSAATVLLSVLGLSQLSDAALWLSSVALVAVGATLVYVVHRYVVVRMGVVET